MYEVFPELDTVETFSQMLDDGYYLIDTRCARGRLLGITHQATFGDRLADWDVQAQAWPGKPPYVYDSPTDIRMSTSYTPPPTTRDDRSPQSVLYLRVQENRGGNRRSTQYVVNVEGGATIEETDLDTALRKQHRYLLKRHAYLKAYFRAYDALPEPLDCGFQALFDVAFHKNYYGRSRDGTGTTSENGRAYNRRHFHACPACGGSGSYCQRCSGSGCGARAA